MSAQVVLAAGTRIGPYEIVGELGNGGMSVVYRAIHVVLGRPAAIKVLRPEYGAFTPALDRFLNEARATTAVRHPGIIEIFDYGHTDSGRAYIAMELLEGATLGARLAERGPLPVTDALALARRIAAPLAVAHEAGIVHRDIKPDNVFLIRDPAGGALDQVKLLDFGIARLESAASRTTIGMVLGTPAYMSPEQCRGVPDCDHRADLYALGCILFELLTGAAPYGNTGSMTQLMAAHMNAPIPALPGVPRDVARLVTRLLAKAAADRPRHATEVVHDIERCLAALAPAPHASAGASLRVAIATAIGLALSLTGVGVWYRGRRAGPADDADVGVDAGVVRARGTAVVPRDAGSFATDATLVWIPPPALPPPSPAQASPSIDAAPSAPPPDAMPALAKPRVDRTPLDTVEVITDLGSAGTADVNTTVTP